MGSEKLKSERADRGTQGGGRQVRPQDRVGQAPHPDRRAPADVAELSALADHVEERANAVEREPITVVCSQKGWLRALEGPSGTIERGQVSRRRPRPLLVPRPDHRSDHDAVHRWTLLYLDGSKLPGGRGNGEAIRTFIDLPPDADIVTMFAHVPGRKLLVAATSGHGFVTNEDDAVAMTKNGKRVMNVKPGWRRCLAVRSMATGRGGGREPQAADLQAGRGPGTGARAGRLSAALQGWRADRRRDLHLEERARRTRMAACSRRANSRTGEASAPRRAASCRVAGPRVESSAKTSPPRAFSR